MMIDRAAQTLERLGADQRRVTEDDEDIVGALGDRLARAQHGVPRAAPLGLNEDLRLGQRAPCLLGDGLRVRPDHDCGLLGAGPAHRVKDMGKQRAPRYLVQHLRPRGAHARALAGGEHDCETGSFAHS